MKRELGFPIRIINEGSSKARSLGRAKKQITAFDLSWLLRNGFAIKEKENVQTSFSFLSVH
jgi:hypothetical protein